MKRFQNYLETLETFPKLLGTNIEEVEISK
jgi:hypothetical protein